LLYFIKWVSIIIVALFLAWLLPILFMSSVMKSYNSLPEFDKQKYITESAQVLKNGFEPIFKKYQLNVESSIPQQKKYTSYSKFKVSDNSLSINKNSNLHKTAGSSFGYNSKYINVQSDDACAYWSRRYFDKKTDFNKIHLRYSCSR